MSSERFERGWQLIERIFGQVGVDALARLEDTAPDLRKYIVEFGYGDIYSRPALDLKVRSIATVAALTALNTSAAQLKAHIHGALTTGCSREEIVEIIIQMALYAGFPAAMNGIAVAREAFAEIDARPSATVDSREDAEDA